MPWSEPPATFTSMRSARHAKALRRALIGPEKRLWWHLRHRLPIEGSHFRRQVPIADNVADFCCLRHRLVVELDGDQHGYDRQAAYDLRRTAVLESLGYRVLRFPNGVVLHQIEVVLDTIAAALTVDVTACAASGITPTPDPSPQGGGE